MRKAWSAASCFVSAVIASAAPAAAQTTPKNAPSTLVLPTIDIFSITPLSGVGIDIDKVPGAVTIVNTKDIERERSSNVVKSLTNAAPSVTINEVSGNTFQPNVEFRGFIASPIAGTPQGLAIYQNGVRINEAFGDTVNWDLIPTAAVRSIDVISNNPAFGLNALGGALSVQMKDGFGFHGVAIDAMGGSYGRLQSSVQVGKQAGNFAVYGALEAVQDLGFRQFSPSQIRRGYADLGYKGDAAEVHLNLGGATNTFGATVAAPIELLTQNWSAVYTNPQTTLNQVGYANLTGNVDVNHDWSLQGALHIRSFYQSTIDGNATATQPCDPTQGGAAGMLCFGDPSTPANGTKGGQLSNPFSPNATLGEIDRTSTQTTSYGASLQGTDVQKIFGHDNRFVIGGSFDYGITNFGANAQLSTIGPGFVLPGGGPFLGESGNPVSDGPVALRATNAYTGLYAFDAFDVTKAWTVTAGGRLNVADVHLRDQLGTALNGDDRFIRFNPMIGTTYRITNDVTAYAGYSEANRAPTPLELGCANPLHPCIIGSFLVSDPPLKQVVARTYEAGLRGVFDAPGGWGTTNWKLGAFRTDSQNDIMNVPSPTLQGFGYFTNVGATRRQGIEAQVDHKFDKLTVHLGYAYVDATFQTPLTLSSNSPFADANGFIFVKPGDRVPMIPQHRAKFSADYELTPEIKLGTEVVAVGSQYFAGDASNQAGQLPAYAVVNLDASYKITKNIELYAKMENALGARYYSFGTFFDTNQVPNFAAGGAPFSDPRTVSPAQPRSVYAGMKATF